VKNKIKYIKAQVRDIIVINDKSTFKTTNRPTIPYIKKKGKRINKEENLAKNRSVEFKKVNP
jgi:hypothetical protein